MVYLINQSTEHHFHMRNSLNSEKIRFSGDGTMTTW